MISNKLKVLLDKEEEGVHLRTVTTFLFPFLFQEKYSINY